MAACTCYQLVTVLINISGGGDCVQIYYCAPGLKLCRVSHYTALWVNSDVGCSAMLPQIMEPQLAWVQDWCDLEKNRTTAQSAMRINVHVEMMYVGRAVIASSTNIQRLKCAVVSHCTQFKPFKCMTSTTVDRYLEDILSHSCYSTISQPPLVGPPKCCLQFHLLYFTSLSF